ncbi:LytR/AlgR family response regulator transcription factor [Mucilaginibacter sp. HD30]
MTTEKIILSQQDNIFFVHPDEILFCQSDSCYTSIYLITGNRVLIVKSLTKFQSELSQKDFIRVNQSYLVNMRFVKIIDKKKRCLELENDHVIPFTVTLKHLLNMMGRNVITD